MKEERGVNVQLDALGFEGLDESKKSDPTDTLYANTELSEDVFVQEHGGENIITMGQGVLTKKHLTELIRQSSQNVIILCDNITSENAFDAIKLILTVTDITPFVLDIHLLRPHKNPDEYVKANGVESFKSILRKVSKGAIWLAEQILEKGEDGSPLDKQKSIDTVIELTQRVKSPLDVEEIISVISDKLKCNKTVVKEWIKAEHKKNKSKVAVNSCLTKGKFWSVFTSGIEINMREYINFIIEEGFCKYYIDKDYIFVRTQGNIVREYSQSQIKDHILSYVNNLEDDEFNTRHNLHETLYNNVGRYFNEGLVECIPSIEINFNRDEKDRAYIYYNNGLVCLNSKTNPGLSDYKNLQAPIWEHIINKRSIDLIKVKYKKPEYEQFLWNVVGGNEERFLSLCSSIGYMLHGYKEESNAKAVVLCDQKIQDDNEPNGRTGKSLIGKALDKIKNVERVDGKNYEFKSTFTFQMVKLGTQIIDFNDVKANFDFERLFSVITDGMTIEYKNRSPFVIPFPESSKIMISTNYTIKGIGSSYKDRMFEIEFSDHYTPDHKPKDEFGHDFFTGWDAEEWNRFDNFMLECLQLYLDEGLISCELVNLTQRKLIDRTSLQLVEFADNIIRKNKEYNLAFLYSEFKDYMGFGRSSEDHCPIKQNTFTSWLNDWAHYRNAKRHIRQSNGNQIVCFAT
jgi:hypothetical protein